MSHANYPTVVKRGGFLSAVAHGVFGLLIVVVVCGAGIGMYALHIVDQKAERVLGLGAGVVTSLPESLPQLRASLPPALADAMEDVRDPAYREQVEVTARLSPPGDRGARFAVIDVTNQGERTITLMALRVVLIDANDVPVRSIVTYAATPLTLDNEWRGPILPGSQRLCSEPFYAGEDVASAEVEVADLRVWQPEAVTPELDREASQAAYTSAAD